MGRPRNAQTLARLLSLGGMAGEIEKVRSSMSVGLCASENWSGRERDVTADRARGRASTCPPLALALVAPSRFPGPHLLKPLPTGPAALLRLARVDSGPYVSLGIAPAARGEAAADDITRRVRRVGWRRRVRCRSVLLACHGRPHRRPDASPASRRHPPADWLC
jgi:hypothetical protein